MTPGFLTKLTSEGADVCWITGALEGVPMLILESTGPSWATVAMTAEWDCLHYKILSELSLDPDTEGLLGEPIFSVFEPGQIQAPLFCTDEVDENIDRFDRMAREAKGWVLVMQFMLAEQKALRLWHTTLGDKPKTELIGEDQDDGVVFKWLA